MLYILSILQCF